MHRAAGGGDEQRTEHERAGGETQRAQQGRAHLARASAAHGRRARASAEGGGLDRREVPTRIGHAVALCTLVGDAQKCVQHVNMSTCSTCACACACHMLCVTCVPNVYQSRQSTPYAIYMQYTIYILLFQHPGSSKGKRNATRRRGCACTEHTLLGYMDAGLGVYRCCAGLA